MDALSPHGFIIRQAAKTKKRNVYHNTLMMLRHYRDINWALECFPADIADELESPLNDLDALLSLINAELSMDDMKLENRLISIQKSRLLLDRFNEALSVKFSDVMKDVYSKLLGLSTILAVTSATIALLVRMISRNQRAVDEATTWLKRIAVTWVILNTLGFIVAYIQPWFAGGQYSP